MRDWHSMGYEVKHREQARQANTVRIREDQHSSMRTYFARLFYALAEWLEPRIPEPQRELSVPGAKQSQ